MRFGFPDKFNGWGRRDHSEKPMTQIFADGADLGSIAELAKDPRIAGYTTNPTLMRKAGVSRYADFARAFLNASQGKPVSFEVLSDEPEGMLDQARVIAGWGPNAVVKIPVMNTSGEPTALIVAKLASEGVCVNVTAIMTLSQVSEAAHALGQRSGYISLFAGRVADTGRDPVPVMMDALEIMKPYPGAKLIWASPREVLNYYQAERIACHVITMTPDLIKKLALCGKGLRVYSLETVKMFYEDGKALREAEFA
jgi:transaldolase